MKFSINDACKLSVDIQAVLSASSQQQDTRESFMWVKWTIIGPLLPSQHGRGKSTHYMDTLVPCAWSWENPPSISKFSSFLMLFKKGTWSFFEASHRKAAPDGVGQQWASIRWSLSLQETSSTETLLADSWECMSQHSKVWIWRSAHTHATTESDIQPIISDTIEEQQSQKSTGESTIALNSGVSSNTVWWWNPSWDHGWGQWDASKSQMHAQSWEKSLLQAKPWGYFVVSLWRYPQNQATTNRGDGTPCRNQWFHGQGVRGLLVMPSWDLVMCFLWFMCYILIGSCLFSSVFTLGYCLIVHRCLLLVIICV